MLHSITEYLFCASSLVAGELPVCDKFVVQSSLQILVAEIILSDLSVPACLSSPVTPKAITLSHGLT